MSEVPTASPDADPASTEAKPAPAVLPYALPDLPKPPPVAWVLAAFVYAATCAGVAANLVIQFLPAVSDADGVCCSMVVEPAVSATVGWAILLAGQHVRFRLGGRGLLRQPDVAYFMAGAAHGLLAAFGSWMSSGLVQTFPPPPAVAHVAAGATFFVVPLLGPFRLLRRSSPADGNPGAIDG